MTLSEITVIANSIVAVEEALEKTKTTFPALETKIKADLASIKAKIEELKKCIENKCKEDNVE